MWFITESSKSLLYKWYEYNLIWPWWSDKEVDVSERKAKYVGFSFCQNSPVESFAKPSELKSRYIRRCRLFGQVCRGCNSLYWVQGWNALLGARCKAHWQGWGKVVLIGLRVKRLSRSRVQPLPSFVMYRHIVLCYYLSQFWCSGNRLRREIPLGEWKKIGGKLKWNLPDTMEDPKRMVFTIRFIMTATLMSEQLAESGMIINNIHVDAMTSYFY